MISILARPHPFPLDIARCALLVIDVQNDFCHPEGYCLGDMGADAVTAARVRSIIPRLQRLIAWARGNHLPIIFTKEAHLPDLSDAPPAKQLRYRNAGYPIGSLGKCGRYLIRGEWGSRVVEELAVQPEDIAIDKPAQSVFVGTDLLPLLTDRGITHLLITGVTTQCCVLATYRQASDLGFYPLLLEDCCAAFDPGEHQAAVAVVESEGGAVGWVGISDDILGACVSE